MYNGVGRTSLTTRKWSLKSLNPIQNGYVFVGLDRYGSLSADFRPFWDGLCPQRIQNDGPEMVQASEEVQMAGRDEPAGWL